MGFSTDSFEKWVEAKDGAAGDTLSSHYLGEEQTGLNADQVTRVATSLWHDFCVEQAEPEEELTEDDLAQRFGEWAFVRGGMTQAEIAMDGNGYRMERFCGGWRLDSDDTATLLGELYEAAPEDKRP